MLNNFINFTQSLFPSINPYIHNQTKKSLEQFKSSEKLANFLTDIPYSYMAQGDIFDNIPFVTVKKDGTFAGTRQKAMLLSNTCSAENDKDIILAPVFKINEIGLHVNNVSDNLNFHLMYIPDEKYKDYVVDFSRMNSFDKDMITTYINQKNITKEASLNQFGYYFLLCKLTINFMRPEDVGVQEERISNYYTIYSS